MGASQGTDLKKFLGFSIALKKRKVTTSSFIGIAINGYGDEKK